jgi:Mn-dependent DtxR family transcriptional regulator
MPKPASSNILPFPSHTEREEKSARVETQARSLEVSPPGVRQILEMARHALLLCSDRVLVDAVERGAADNCARPVRLPLDFTQEIEAIDAALAELQE